MNYADALIRMAEVYDGQHGATTASQLGVLAADGGSPSQLRLRVSRLLDGTELPSITPYRITLLCHLQLRLELAKPTVS